MTTLGNGPQSLTRLLIIKATMGFAIGLLTGVAIGMSL